MSDGSSIPLLPETLQRIRPRERHERREKGAARRLAFGGMFPAVSFPFVWLVSFVVPNSSPLKPPQESQRPRFPLFFAFCFDSRAVFYVYSYHRSQTALPILLMRSSVSGLGGFTRDFVSVADEFLMLSGITSGHTECSTNWKFWSSACSCRVGDWPRLCP